MKIYLGSDHRGFKLKEQIKKYLSEKYELIDLGAETFNPQDDYVDFASKVAKEVCQNYDNFGIVICGSGAGAEITVNKVNGIRGSIGFDPDQIKSARNDDNINILSIAADFIDFQKAKEIINIFLETKFDPSEKHLRRIEKIKNLES